MFKANIIEGGNGMAEALIYKPPPQNVVEYLHHNMVNLLDNARNLGSNFVNTVRDMWNNSYSDEARKNAKMLLYGAGNHLSQNVIIPVQYQQLHLANQTMQNYILAQPDMAKLYQKGVCYGYADTHIPIEIDTYGKDTMAYNQVMDGVVQWDEGEDLGYVKHVSQDDEVLNGDLHYLDQIAILDTWDNVALMLANGLDPSDPVLEEI